MKLWDVTSGQELHTLKGHEHRVWSVAFSPDGMRLASAGQEQTVKVWDVASGKELCTLKGHTDRVWSVAFSPDGTRLASASEDKTVRLWDVARGQEVRTLKGHTGPVLSVAFSPDGMRLASAGDDRTIRIWDARPLTGEVQAEQEALGLVDFLFSKGLVKTQVIESLRGNKTISEVTRQKAFAFVDGCWNAVVYQRAICWVDSFFGKPILKPDAIESARNNHALREEVRQKASALADRWRADGGVLNEASWAVMRKPGADASAYRLAVRRAEEACQLWADNPDILNTLGIAQYRVGQYLQATKMLTQADRLHEVRGPGSAPADLAFLAMAHYRLGQKEKALDYLNRVRELTKTEWWAMNDEDRAFLREAEALINGATANPKSAHRKAESSHGGSGPSTGRGFSTQPKRPALPRTTSRCLTRDLAGSVRLPVPDSIGDRLSLLVRNVSPQTHPSIVDGSNQFRRQIGVQSFQQLTRTVRPIFGTFIRKIATHLVERNGKVFQDLPCR